MNQTEAEEAICQENKQDSLRNLRSRKFFGSILRVMGVPLAFVGAWALNNLLEGRNISLENVLASNDPFSKHVREGNMLSQNLGSKEILPASQSYEFDFDGDHYSWYINNASSGINPPNDPERRIGTIQTYKNYDYVNYVDFQPLGSLYAEELAQGPGVSLVVGGRVVNTSLDKYYFEGGATRNDGNFDSSLEMGNGIKTPNSYTGRARVKKGLPVGGIHGRTSTVVLGSDTQGNYARIIYNYCVIPAENGTYEVRLDSQGNFASDTFIKVESFKVFLPIVIKGSN